MTLADQFAGAIPLAQFHELGALSTTLWKAYAAGHIGEAETHALSEAIEAKRPRAADPTSFRAARAPKPAQRSPDRQASIERRRRLARASPVPPDLVDQFTQGEHAVITVVAGEITRAGACTWCLDRIAALAGGSRTLVRVALRKARALGLMFSTERRRRGQKSLTNIVRVLRRSWGAWLQRIGRRKSITTSDIDSRKGKAGGVESFGERFPTAASGGGRAASS